MKADEYMVLAMAVDEGIQAGLFKVFPDEVDFPTHMYESEMSEALAEAVMNSILAWFHIERPWIKDSDA